MNLISVEGISKSFGERVLFSELSFGINKDQKIALIAQNGTGKTSILNILAGKDSPDTGLVTERKSTRISYLEQDPQLDPTLTIEEAIFASDNEVLKVIQNYEHALENPEDEKKYQKAFEAMERFNAWDFETQYKQILSKLQLEDLKVKVGSLSGGQKKRSALANALLNRPD
ncbi:ATP-binding cassette domain-containing protein, partial [Muriicola sp.]|uniref:ATP-binding cassette domain-containing protein n=1 Tax=Muriicola sp. TaxID=2020856 RepID=UPI003C711950